MNKFSTCWKALWLNRIFSSCVKRTVLWSYKSSDALRVNSRCLKVPVTTVFYLYIIWILRDFVYVEYSLKFIINISFEKRIYIAGFQIVYLFIIFLFTYIFQTVFPNCPDPYYWLWFWVYEETFCSLINCLYISFVNYQDLEQVLM